MAQHSMKIQYENLTIRQAEVADAKQLAAWWNDGAVMAHAGFPDGLGTTEEEAIEGLEGGPTKAISAKAVSPGRGAYKTSSTPKRSPALFGRRIRNGRKTSGIRR